MCNTTILLWPGSCFVFTLCVHMSQNSVDYLITICRHATDFWDFNVLPTTIIPVGNIVAHWYQWNKRASKNHQPISGSPSPLFPKKNLPGARNNSARFSWSLFPGEKFHWGSFPNCLILIYLRFNDHIWIWAMTNLSMMQCLLLHGPIAQHPYLHRRQRYDVKRGQVGMKGEK